MSLHILQNEQEIHDSSVALPSIADQIYYLWHCRKATERVFSSEICGSGEESDGRPGSFFVNIYSTEGQSLQLKKPSEYNAKLSLRS